ncbi:hypothetical protein GT348_05660 [Aristophania vespae]|uniref:Glycosyltransferase family 2 protein n=1 Tax=Aristophania vespae TaxID=2697033 RepID=A0A6P1NLQ7_9PROT|nr:glycosyltransferase family 2 protein [Aristophania vespae]QHI95801.1 hypothetical protein GT348_05660 [Aristophania vespae]
MRNARKTLHWWIAHHLAVGFTTLYICDDHSDDGTWEFLQTAAHRYDLRISQTDLSITSPEERREKAQRELVREQHQNISWILPLDLDEYFYPESGSVRAFLADLKARYGEETFNLTLSFPINWCISGLNGHHPDNITGNSPSPRTLFNRHAPQEFQDHRIVRFICRPEALAETLPDPFSWSDHDVDWSLGRIMHDAAAQSQGDVRLHYDRNEEVFIHADRFLCQTQLIAARILQAALLALSYKLRERPIQNFDEEQLSIKLYKVVSNGMILYFDHDHNKIVWQNIDQTQQTELAPFYLIGDIKDSIPRNGLNLWGYILPAEKLSSYENYLSVKHSYSELLGFLPLGLYYKNNKYNLINSASNECLFEEPCSFELVSFLSDSALINQTVFQQFSTLFKYGHTAPALIKALKELPWIAPSILGAALLHLSEKEKAQILPLYLQDIFGAASK